MRRAVYGLCALLVGCGAHQEPVRPAEVVERLSGASVADGAPLDRVRQVQFAGEVYQVSAPGAVSLRNVAVCDAAQIVLGDQLSIDHTCAAGGLVSLEFPSGDANRLLAGFIRALRALDLDVELGGSIAITGDREGHATGAEGRMPGGIEGEGGQGSWVSVSLDPAAASAVLDQVASVPGSVVELLPAGAYMEEAERAVNSLGLSVRIARIGGRFFAVGEVSEVGLLTQVLSDFSEVSTHVATAHAPTEVMSSLMARYPGLALEWQADLSRVAVQGPREAAVEAAAVLRELAVPVLPVRVTVTFISYDTADISDQEIEAAFSVGTEYRVGGGAGLLDGASFSATLTDLVERQVVSVERHPVVTTISGRNARFVSGVSVPIVSGINEDGFQQVDYRDTGVVLDVFPSLTANGSLLLTIEAEVSSVQGTGDNPAFSERSVSASVLMAPGDVLAVSGLSETSESVSRGRTFRILPFRRAESATNRIGFFVRADF